jgi:hypothetical protein
MDLTPLEHLEALSDGSRSRLRENHVNSVEELCGLMSADREGARKLLDVDHSELDALESHASTLISPELRSAMSAQRGKTYSGGARDPRERDA